MMVAVAAERYRAVCRPLSPRQVRLAAVTHSRKNRRLQVKIVMEKFKGQVSFEFGESISFFLLN